MNLRPLAAALLAASVCHGGPGWFRYRSEHFELYSDAPESLARRMLQHFERTRAFFQKTTDFLPGKPHPVRIVFYGSAEGFERDTLQRAAAGLFVPGSECDFILINSAAPDPVATANHEYVHLLELRSGMRLPPWLSEGLADLYSTLALDGNSAAVGKLIPHRREILLDSPWTPLREILSADRPADRHRPHFSSAAFYNQSWALTHMLALSEKYQPEFATLLKAVAAGRPSVEALETTYRLPLSQIEMDLQAYVRGQNFRYARFDLPLRRIRGARSRDAAPEFELRVMQADLAGRNGDDATARRLLAELMHQHPERPEPHVVSAYLELLAGRHQQAAAHFRRAFRLGACGAAALWDMGRLLSPSDPREAARAFQRLLSRHRERDDARIELAALYVNLGHAAAALETLKPVQRLGSDEARRYFQVLANAHLASGNRSAAAEAAARWAALARTDAEKAGAAEILRLASDDN
jgi:Tfp pilus assembly protein PilF